MRECECVSVRMHVCVYVGVRASECVSVSEYVYVYVRGMLSMRTCMLRCVRLRL